MNNIYSIISNKEIPSKSDVNIVIDNVLNDLKNKYGKDININLLDLYEFINNDNKYLSKKIKKYLFSISNGIYYENEYVNDVLYEEKIDLFYKNFNSHFWYHLLYTLFHEYYHALSSDKNNQIINLESFIYLMEKEITKNLSLVEEIVLKYNYSNLYSELAANKFALDNLDIFLNNNNISSFNTIIKEDKVKNEYLLENFDINHYLNYFTPSRVRKILNNNDKHTWLDYFWNEDGSFKIVKEITSNTNIDIDLKYFIVSSDNYIKFILKNYDNLSNMEKDILRETITDSINNLYNKRNNILSSKKLQNNKREIDRKKRVLKKIN